MKKKEEGENCFLENYAHNLCTETRNVFYGIYKMLTQIGAFVYEIRLVNFGIIYFL